MDKARIWLTSLGKETWMLLGTGLENMWLWRIQLLLALALLVLLLPFTLPHDAAWLSQLRAHNETAHQVARAISHWGDYLTWTIPFGLLLLALGSLLGKGRWRRAAIACILTASVAGICANLLSFGVGRPRPSTGKPDGIYGPRWDYNSYRSFPSGHAATSMGTATALAVAVPPLGIPCVLYAGAVGWSRMELERHYPTDILVGTCFGIVFGLAFGCAARKSAIKSN